MKTTFMTNQESMTAAMNLESIKFHLGHDIPEGMVDVTELGDKFLTNEEAYIMARNIESVEFHSIRDSSFLRAETLIWCGLAVAVVAFMVISSVF